MASGGDHIELHAIANAFNVEFVVVESGSDNDVAIVLPSAQNKMTRQIFIGHIGQLHYVAMDEIPMQGSSLSDLEQITDHEIAATDATAETTSTSQQPKDWKTAISGKKASDGVVIENSCSISRWSSHIFWAINKVSFVTSLSTGLLGSDRHDI